MARKSEGAGNVLSIRIDDELRKRLQQAADEKGHSLNKEIRLRLERASRDEWRIHQFFGDPKTYFFFRLLHLAVRMLGQYGARRRKFWLDDRYQYVQVATAIKTTLDALEPAGPRHVRGEADPETVGHMIAGHVFESIKAEDHNWPERLKDLKDILESTFEPDVYAGVRQFLGDYLERAPSNVILAGLRRRHGGKK